MPPEHSDRFEAPRRKRQLNGLPLGRALRVHGELRVLLAALVVAISAVAAVGLFTDRVERGLLAEARALLGGDLVIESRQTPRDTLLDRATDLGLRSSVSASLTSVVFGAASERSTLTAVRAVDAAWPLQRDARIERDNHLTAADDDASSETQSTTQVLDIRRPPPVGTVWIDRALGEALDVSLGDDVDVGELTLRVDAWLIDEPDGGADGLFNFAPRLLMNSEDLSDTGLTGFGARVEYRLALAGPSDAIDAFRRGLELEPGERALGLEDGNPELALALERASQFLALTALLAVVLAAAAIAITAHRFADRSRDASAILRSLGASRRDLIAFHGGLFLRILMLALPIGLAIGWLSQLALAATLATLLTTTLPAPSLTPWLSAAAVAIIALIGFASPAVLDVADTPPIRVLRADVSRPRRLSLVTLAALVALCALLLLQTGDVALSAWTLGGLLIALLVLTAIGWLLVRLIDPLRHRGGLFLRFGLANLARRRALTVAQLTAFTLGLTTLLLLAIVRVDLIDAWDASIPPGAPNHFFINIQDEEREQFAAALGERLDQPPQLEPMIRGRLVEIAGQPISIERYDGRDARLLEREFNLSFREAPAAHNLIVKGRWMAADEAGWSVELGIAERFGIQVGDELAFRIAGRSIRAPVANLRAVEWDSFEVNFFVIGTPAMLTDLPQTWITAVHIEDPAASGLAALIRAHPSVTVIDLRRVLAQVRSTVDRASAAVELVFLFSLVAGLTVLAAAAQVTRTLRAREGALLRVLGASRRAVAGTLLAEFAALGLLSGVFASLLAAVLGGILADRVFELAYFGSPLLFATGLGAGLIGVVGMSWLGSRGVLKTAPNAVLRATH
ncbi:MAG: ABC transporter permease [Thioalkalivibrionaceae bacterium]